jgi:Tol biopolymer transport system component
MRALAGLVTALIFAAATAGARAAFPGRNGPIAYAVADPDCLEGECASPVVIREVRSDTRARRDLFAGSSPSFSPEGTRLAFFDGAGFAARLYVRALAGGPRRELLADDGLTTRANTAWSPDGRRIALTASTDATGGQVWVVPLLGGIAERLTGAGGQEPAWSVDGTLAFVRDARIWVLPRGARRAHRLLDVRASAPDWSPDGRRLAFQHCVRACDLWTVDADGGRLRRLTRRAGALHAAWSPDGRFVAFLAVGRRRTGLAVVSIRTHRRRWLVRRGLDAHVDPSWQPLR